MALNTITGILHISDLNSADVKELQSLLKKHGYTLDVDGVYGPETLNTFNQFKQDRHITNLGVIGPTTVKILLDTQAISKSNLITFNLLDSGMPNASTKDINTYLGPLQKYTREYGINTPLRVAAFLAQLAHESGSFIYKEEIATGVAYEGRADLGNVIKGDGKRYKG